MSDDGRVVGQILPAEEGELVTFEILPRRGPRRRRGEDECDHRSFVLDERWRLVRCRDCGDPVDAFAALLRLAERTEWWERRCRQAREADKRLQLERIRRLRRLKTITDGEMERVEALWERRWSATADEMRELATEVEDARRRRLWEKRRERRERKRREEGVEGEIGPGTTVVG